MSTCPVPEAVTYSEGKVFSSENTAEAFFVVDDEDTVGSLGRAELTGVRDAHALWDGESWARSKSGDGPLLSLLRQPFVVVATALRCGSARPLPR